MFKKLKIIATFLIFSCCSSWAAQKTRQITELDLNEYSRQNQGLREVFKSHPVFNTALVRSITKKNGKATVKKINVAISDVILDYADDEWAFYKQKVMDSFNPDLNDWHLSHIWFAENNNLLKLVLCKFEHLSDNEPQKKAIYWNHLTDIYFLESPDHIPACSETYLACHNVSENSGKKLTSKNRLYTVSFDKNSIYLYINQAQLLKKILASPDPIPVYRRIKTV